ncbi:MAG: hypothetical protein GYA12_00775 [Chloroflexi bacterium]|jgi:hypothetical protein|nr:hypothetical protein [Chloroflexota bacterium]
MNSNNPTSGSVKPARMDRLVSVILNGVVLTKMANQHGNNVYTMADTLMTNTSDTVKRSMKSVDHTRVAFCLRKEIRRRISSPAAN